MSLDALIMFCGALVALLPFLGFPNSWDAVMFLVLGLIIVVLGVVVRRRRKDERRIKTQIERSVIPSHLDSSQVAHE